MKYSTIYSRLSKTALAAVLLISALNESAAQSDKTSSGANFKTVSNNNGPALGYSPGSGVKVLTVSGLNFKDLNKNGKLDKYEDWRLPTDVRARDLASKNRKSRNKGWPGGGPEEGGRDAHFAYGKFAVYPGNNFQTQLTPFINGAFKLAGKTKKAAAVMPY